MITFALMTPLGTLEVWFLPILNLYYTEITAVVIGILFHILPIIFVKVWILPSFHDSFGNCIGIFFINLQFGNCRLMLQSLCFKYIKKGFPLQTKFTELRQTKQR
jgi:hypothetical protein